MGELDKVISELFMTGLSLYVLSIFVAFFDINIGNFLRKISYLFAFSILFIVVISVFTIFNDLIDAINNLSESRIFNLFGGRSDFND